MTVAGYPRYESYDKSAADRLEFAFPSHWSTTKTRFLFRFSKGLTITKENLQDDGIPCVNYGEIHSKFGFVVDPATNPLKCVSPDYLKSNNGSLLHHGDFVFADTSEDIEGSGNFTHLDSDIPTFAGYHTLIARADSRAQIRYLAYMLDSSAFRSQVQKAVKGVKVYSISQGLLKNLEVLLPPLPEQRAIAAFLDKKCAAIDEAVRIKQAQIALLQERRQILIQQAVTRGLNPHAPRKDSGIDWIGPIPAHWEVKKVSHTAKVDAGSTPNRSIERYWGGKIPWIKTGEVNYATIWQSEEYITEAGLKESSLRLAPSGTLLMAMYGQGVTRGRVAILGAPAAYNQACCGISFSNLLDVKYAQNYFIAAYPYVRDAGNETSQMNLSAGYIAALKILTPPKKEQTEIILYLDKRSREANKAITIKQSQITVLKEYKTVLINAAVTGKIKVA